MTRYEAHGIALESLKLMNAADVEAAFYPSYNIHRKSEDIRLDFEAIHARIVKDGSNANRYYMWLKYE